VREVNGIAGRFFEFMRSAARLSARKLISVGATPLLSASRESRRVPAVQEPVRICNLLRDRRTLTSRSQRVWRAEATSTAHTPAAHPPTEVRGAREGISAGRERNVVGLSAAATRPYLMRAHAVERGLEEARRCGRPRTPVDVRALIRTVADTNPSGVRRGSTASCRSSGGEPVTVAKYMRRRPTAAIANLTRSYRITSVR
jgi:hypothetical protein